MEHPSGPIHAVVSKEVLQEHFGASDEPEDWLATYRKHEVSINETLINLSLGAMETQQHPWGMVSESLSVSLGAADKVNLRRVFWCTPSSSGSPSDVSR